MLNRRLFLQGASLMGCSALAHPLLSTVTLAEAPGTRRLVVIILRGAMDGLDVVQPYGDPLLAQMRPEFAIGPEAGAPDLDGFFALHPLFAPLMPMWASGDLGFAHALSTPYRDKRSHFDGQDLLEAGTGMDVPLAAVRDGWLNRLIQTLPGARAETAYSVGAEELKLLSGKAPTLSWRPEERTMLSDQGWALFDAAYHDDDLFRSAAAEAREIIAQTGNDAAQTPDSGAEQLAAFAAARLRAETRIAAFSLNGWDTHRNQPTSIRPPAKRLVAMLARLKADLGPVWGETLVLAMTEFGRTARANGNRGTDHGTGGAMVMAGGALKGGKVYGRWPGLAEADLYAGRDLMPTADIRAYAGWALAGLFGTSRGVLEGSVFPGLDLGENPRFLA